MPDMYRISIVFTFAFKFDRHLTILHHRPIGSSVNKHLTKNRANWKLNQARNDSWFEIKRYYQHQMLNIEHWTFFHTHGKNFSMRNQFSANEANQTTIRKMNVCYSNFCFVHGLGFSCHTEQATNTVDGSDA